MARLDWFRLCAIASFLLLAAGCVRVERYGDLKCETPWSPFPIHRQCMVENIPLREGRERTFTIGATNMVPNVLDVNLKGIHSPEYFVQKLHSTELQVEVMTLDGNPALSKTVDLAKCRTQRMLGSKKWVRFEIFDANERLFLGKLQKYRIHVTVLKDGNGGKRRGTLRIANWE
jgi:hypothetical protein